jgi:hypothetical protein
MHESSAADGALVKQQKLALISGLVGAGYSLAPEGSVGYATK